ncbi:TPA: hypothetical protein ACSQFT_001813 [Pseudomonas aeruginosa]
MSSIQHQLIEQCVTRLRGIVEALDNIHDTSPQCWSTDLDDVHSSAESLLALIKDQAPPSEDQLTAAGLSYPLAKEDAVKLWYSGFRSEVITVLEAWEAIGHDTGINPDKEELLESLRNMAAICNAHGNDMPAQSAIDQRQVIADAITGALAFGAQASQPPAEDHWLRPFYDIGRAEGQRTQDLAMLVRMLASSLKRHAPESNLVARATNYLMAKGLTGSPLRNPLVQAEDAPVIGCLCGMPMTEGHHSPDGCCNLEEFAPQAQAEKAEAERQEVVDFNPYRYHAEKIRQRADGAASAYEAGRSALGYMEDIAESALIVRNGLDELSAQHERITAKLHDALDESDGDRWKMRSERDAANARLHEVATACATAEQERDAALAEVERLRQFERICEGLPQDAIDGGWTVQGIRGYAKRLEDQLKSALARVAELEKQEPVGWANFRDGRFGAYLHRTEDDARRFDSTALAGKPAGSKQLALYAAPVAQAQHSVPEEVRTLLSRAQCEIEHLAECLENVCEDEEDFDVREDVADGRVVAADIAHMLAAAPGKEVPQAWLDVQAERLRQVEAEGWTPEHDDEHACDEIAAFACFYAMPPAARDWDASSTGYGDTLGEAILPEGWEPKTGDRRRDLVKACALALAEIERLDRAGISQNPQPGATRASS